MNRSTVSCDASPTNAYYNNATAIPDQSISNSDNLQIFLVYGLVGATASVFNIICILTFITKKELREKYSLFAFLAFGNLINTVFMCQAGFLRRYLIYNNKYMQVHSAFECLLFANPHLQLLGGQLPAVVLLVIDPERLVAVYRPIFYKVHVNDRTRIRMIIGCIVVVLISQLFGYLSSYLNRFTCVNSFCAIMSTYGLSYSNYNSAIVILFPIGAFILNVLTYIGAKRLGTHANMKKELQLILRTLVITFVDVCLIACPNIVVFLTYNKLAKISIIIQDYLYVVFCCNSAINLFVYIFLKREFRNHLLMSISCGALKPYLKISYQAATAIPRRRTVSRVAFISSSNTVNQEIFGESDVEN